MTTNSGTNNRYRFKTNFHRLIVIIRIRVLLACLIDIILIIVYAYY